MSEYIKTSTSHRLARLTLDRPRALNALSLDMVRAITAVLSEWRNDDAYDAVVIDSSMGRAFCAGGDIRYFHEMAKATPAGGSAALEDFFTEEYALNYLIHSYPKPYIALMDGVVMGGGMGISQGSRATGMRIVTERTKMAMPEVNIGLFPDVGGSYFLSRARRRIGWYLALTGHVIGGLDAVYAGLADALVPFEKHPELLEALAGADFTEQPDAGKIDTDARNAQQARTGWRETVLSFATASMAGADGAVTTEAPLAAHQAAIDRHFSYQDIRQIMASLAGDESAFAQEALAAMQARSPMMMAVALSQLQRGATLSLADCLRMERGMVRNCFARGEVVEGIRAAVIDKDHAPRWNPSSIDEVSPALVESFFVPVWPQAAHPLRHLGN